MDKNHINISFKFVMLIFGIVFSSLVSCSEETKDIEEKINNFQNCITKQPKKIKGKICNAYVPWEGDINELVDCLKNSKITQINPIKDSSKEIFRINVLKNCKHNRQIAIQFEKSEATGDFFINLVGEVVY